MDFLSLDFVLLNLAALLTSIVSGFLGMAGGIMLLSIMAQYFPPVLLIPLHGIIQLGSNSSRAFINRENISWGIVKKFVPGVILGAAIGSQVVVNIPEMAFKIILGSFILVVTWMPKFKFIKRPKYKFTFLGFFTSFLSLFVGATGPLKAPFFLNEDLSKEAIVATKALCQSAVHTFKVIVFVSLGFQLAGHEALVVSMIAMVFLGSYLGKLLLNRLPEKLFLLLFKAVITILAARMLINAFS